jgi:transposase InsO family protein
VARAGVAGAKGGPSGQNRTADEPGQTLNVDLCFVPATHEAARRLPAVSGSSGRLVISGPRPGPEDPERGWPGQVFEDPETAYGAAMQEFVRRSAPCTPRRTAARAARGQRPETAEQVARRTRREQQRRLAAHRGPLLQQRQQEDDAWQAVCRERQARLRPDHWTPTYWAAHLVAEDHYQLLRAQRQATLARRQQEDAQWQADQAQLEATPVPPAAKPPWIAILVVTDNCTRQCLGLPLFAAGPKVTAAVVVAALRALLPDELQFLISDRGTHFTANPFAQFAQEEDFVHVLIARHRPESNGIAERFVRTLKEWLAERAWSGVEALALCLEQFCAAYNDRPHQGLALPGLSPNEFAARFWLL